METLECSPNLCFNYKIHIENENILGEYVLIAEVNTETGKNRPGLPRPHPFFQLTPTKQALQPSLCLGLPLTHGTPGPHQLLNPGQVTHILLDSVFP
jgi:hypothetical protein